MINYKKWDIVLVRFPFTDLKTTKQRPALIISPDKYNLGGDVIIVFITSQLDVAKRPGDYLIKEWQEARLPKPSMIRMKFATISPSIVIKKLGRLTNKDIKNYQNVLIDFFSK
jgi:mRNA interferase MazF